MKRFPLILINLIGLYPTGAYSESPDTSCTVFAKGKKTHCTEYFYKKSDVNLYMFKRKCVLQNIESMRKSGSSSEWSEKEACSRKHSLGVCEMERANRVEYFEKSSVDIYRKGLELAFAGCHAQKGTWKQNPRMKIKIDYAKLDPYEILAKHLQKAMAEAEPRKMENTLRGDHKGACYTYLEGKLYSCRSLSKLNEVDFVKTRIACEARGMVHPSKDNKPSTKWVDDEECPTDNMVGSCTSQTRHTQQKHVWYSEYLEHKYDSKESIVRAIEGYKDRTCEDLDGTWQAGGARKPAVMYP